MVRTERADGVLHVTLDRPEKRNALRRVDIEAVTRALGADDGLRAVVFRGAGDRAFSAGVDIGEFLALDGPEAARAFIAALRDMLAAVRRIPAVTICAIDGPCLGGAFELALAADLRVVTTRARFGLPEVRLGIPSVIEAALLAPFVGLGHAKEMILTGDVYAADAPQVAALAGRPVAPEDLETAVTDLLGRVGGHTRTVVAAQKGLFETWQDQPLSAGIDASVDVFAGVFAAEDTRAALAAYRSSLGAG
ncbi:enoyl-CoA hydratase/isomerase family protein [Actinomycetospora aeridis]|uniref:Enoyl-CoA hydratase-related protein n=1 Tax=Actinomycetospora aeridis TaxID=3129231 RepID=A0ABU8N029_9PSEU